MVSCLAVYNCTFVGRKAKATTNDEKLLDMSISFYFNQFNRQNEANKTFSTNPVYFKLWTSVDFLTGTKYCD